MPRAFACLRSSGSGRRAMLGFLYEDHLCLPGERAVLVNNDKWLWKLKKAYPDYRIGLWDSGVCAACVTHESGLAIQIWANDIAALVPLLAVASRLEKTPDGDAMVAAYAEQKKSIHTIAAEFKTSYPKVRRTLLANGVEIRPRGRVKKG